MIATFTLHATGQKVSAELKEIEKEFLIYFELPENYDYNFGFDSFRMSKKGAEDKEKLKNEYRKYTIADKEYLAPWVSIRQGQTITLTMKIKKKRNFKTQRIELSHSDFTFSPDKITPETFAKSKKVPIQITCNTTFTQDQVVELKTKNGEMVGAIAFMENEVKELKHPIRWVIPEFNNGDEKLVKNIVDKQKLDSYFKKAFTPALIDITFVEDKILNLRNLDKNIKTIIFGNNQNFNVILRGRIALVILLYESVKRNEYQISLFTPFIKSEKEKGEDTEHNNGINWHNRDLKKDLAILNYINDVRTKIYNKPSNIAMIEQEAIEDNEAINIIFLGNNPNNRKTDVEIPHEVMHALRLEHTFSETFEKDKNKKHIFRKGATCNYMDYDNNKEYTQKWQWELMRKSKYIKLLILFFSLFLSSCKTMSYQEIQKISCDYEILIPKGERKIEIPFKGEKYYEINNDSIYRGINEYLHDPNIRFSVFTNYRKMGIKSYTQYHFDGNIFSKIFFYSSSNIDEGFQTLKIYYFDVDGNIVKKENNDNWNICAFQALAIAKKRIKEKKRGEWFLEKSIFKNEKCWQVSYYYKRKYKIFFVDKDTGEILKINKV